MPAVVNVDKPSLSKSLVRNLPVARFYYQGSHTHPIRRTVLMIESDSDQIKGYEIRCGNNIFEPFDDRIRSYSRDKIAKVGDYSRIRNSKKNVGRSDDESTFVRSPIKDLRNGI